MLFPWKFLKKHEALHPPTAKKKTHQQISLASLFQEYPALEEVEANLNHRFETRRNILRFVPKRGVGVELGVYTGGFSEMLVQVTRPKKFYAVDAWWLLFGDNFEDWGAYTAFGKLETRAAHAATVKRLERFPHAEIIVAMALDWIASLDEGALDWAYIDTSHLYEPTLAELNALADKLSPDGVLLRDDCWARRDNNHYSVFRAVRDFCRARNFEIISLDGAGQWAARRTID